MRATAAQLDVYNVVCVSVCACGRHNREPCKTNRSTDRGAVCCPTNHVLDVETHWRHLASTIEWFLLGGDAGCRYHYSSNSFPLTDHCV